MNFVEMVVDNVKNNKQMKVKNYEFVSPTYNTDLIHCLWENIINIPYSNPIKNSWPGNLKSNPGIYHIVNEGIYTWYRYAYEIAGMVDKDKTNIIIPMIESESPVEKMIRPKCGLMKSSFEMPKVTDALNRYLKEKGLI